MEIGMIGLGRMGGSMATRLLRRGHRVIAYDRSEAAVRAEEAEGAIGATSLQDFVAAFEARPRVMWVMVPSGDPTTETIKSLASLGDTGDIVIDGGNTSWRVAVGDAVHVKEHGMHYLDAGTSGGIWGLANGYCLMVGGEQQIFEHCLPLLRDLAPEDGGLVHTGSEGSGHFVKMVHNGIEYGMMQAMAEGFAIMKRKEEFGLDLHQVAEIWRYGSVVRSWLLDLTARALADDQDLARIAPHVADSGEGRWTVVEAIDLDVAAPVITLALQQRLRSRDEYSFTDRLLAMMRYQFGGHEFRREQS